MSDSVPPSVPPSAPTPAAMPVALPGGDWPELAPGWVWLVGAGPGDAGLLTLHGLNALRQAEVIVVDALVDPALLGWAPSTARVIPMGKRGGRPSPTQGEISALLVEQARAGRRVVRLKGGDPFMFGRGGEEALDLVRAGIPFRVVPGITAGLGGLAHAGIPVTHRDVGSAVSFVTGHHPEQVNWQALADASPDIVIYMGMRNLEAIRAALLAAGRPADEPVAIVENATRGDQRVLETTLGACVEAARAAGARAPAIICVGRAVLLRRALDWQALAAGAPPRDLDPLDGA